MTSIAVTRTISFDDAQSRGTAINARFRGFCRRILHEDRDRTCARVDSSCGKKERLARV